MSWLGYKCKSDNMLKNQTTVKQGDLVPVSGRGAVPCWGGYGSTVSRSRQNR